MSYGHAETILAAGKKSPVPELKAAVRRLKAWADVNPPLMDVYKDFEVCLSDVVKFVRDSEKEK